MTTPIRVYVNERPVEVPPGSDVLGAVRASEPALAAALADGAAYVTDGRGVALDPHAPLAAGSILRVVRPARPRGATAGATGGPASGGRAAERDGGPGLSREQVARLPKIDLHVHLDGSLRPETMLDLAGRSGVRLPAAEPEALRRYMIASDARNLEDYLRRFELTTALLRTPEAIERVAYEMVEDAARDNVRYLEVRYCPLLSRGDGLTLDQVTAAELRGLARGEREFGVVARAVHCSLRHLPPQRSEEIARTAVAWRDRGVVGFDLAGAEAGRPAAPHRRAFEIAAAGGLGITVHAGEAAGPDSIAEAIRVCGAQRIGHGTRLHEDPALRDWVRERGILLEVNLTSNVQTRVVPELARHPARGYLAAGLAVSLSSDNWLISGTTTTQEYWLAHRALGFTRADLERTVLDGIRAAFLPEAERRALLARVRAELAEAS